MKNLKRKQSNVQQQQQNRPKENTQKKIDENSPYYQQASGIGSKNPIANLIASVNPSLIASNNINFPYNVINQKINVIKGQPQQMQQQSMIQQNNSIYFERLEQKMAKLLFQSSKREQLYHQFIKKKQQQSYQMTEKYVNSLKRYKQQLDKYIDQRNNKKIGKFQKYKSNKVLSGQFAIVNKFLKVKLSHLAQNKQGKQNNKYQIKMDLKCKIAFNFFAPFTQDFLKQKFPTNLNFRIVLPIRKRYLIHNQKNQKIISTLVKLDEDQNQNIQNLIHDYPFPLVCSQKRNNIEGLVQVNNQNKHASYQITIVNEQENIKILQNSKIWVSIIDRDSQLVYAYTSFPSHQLLYYSQESTYENPVSNDWYQVFECYSPFSHKKNCKIHLKFSNTPEYFNDASNRMEVTQPIQLGKLHIDRNIYGDKQSRQIQRINKFKTTNTSLIMRPDAQYYGNQVDKQEIFKNTNDKTLIMHRKMKEIQSINQYKSKHKQQYMQKILDQALQKFSLQQIQLGVPKQEIHEINYRFLVFYYEKFSSNAETIFIKPKIQKLEIEADVLKQIEIKLVNKNVVQKLMKDNVIKIKQGVSFDIEGSQKEGIYVFDKSIAIVLKVIIYPTKKLSQFFLKNKHKQSTPSSINQQSSSTRFDLSMKIESQTGQLLSEQVYKLQPIRLNCEYELAFHNYEGQLQQIQIPLNICNAPKSANTQNEEEQQQINTSKNSKVIKVIASQDIEYKISSNNDKLDVRVKYQKLTKSVANTPNHERFVEVVLLDENYDFVLSTYLIKLTSYHPMAVIETYSLGEICKYRFQLNADEQFKRRVALNSSTKSNHNTKIIRARFYTSHLNECTVRCLGKSQFIMDQNKIYQAEANFQTFESNNLQDRVIIHLIDIDSGDILKKWLLKIKKTLQQYKKVYQISITRNQPLTFKYQLKNSLNKQSSYKFFCSNSSILSVPQLPIILQQRQQTTIQLQINIKKQDSTTQQHQIGHLIVMRIQRSQQKVGWNQLFKIFVE